MSKGHLKLFSVFIILFLIILTSLYYGNLKVRNFIDVNIIKKEIKENKEKSVTFSKNDNPQITATNFNVYAIFNGQLKIYDNTNREKKLEKISIGNPIYSTNDRYLAIAQKDSTIFYLVDSEKISWERKVDLPISSIYVNKNGYILVVSKNSLYKSIVNVFDNLGNRIFRTYLSDTFATSLEITDDNKHLLIGSVDYSKPIVTTNIKVISIDIAKTEPEKATIFEYNIPKLLVKLKVKDSNEALVQTTTGVYRIGITKQDEEEIFKNESNTVLVEIDTNNNLIIIEKENINENTENLTIKYKMKIVNNYNKQISVVDLEDKLVKRIKTNADNITLDFGNKIEVYSLNGWLKKRYVSNTEILDYHISNNLLVVLFDGKFEIVNI